MTEQTERKWQVEEGGPLVKVPKGAKHPWENRAFWRKHLRVFILQRDPICKICGRSASEIVDHIVPFITPEGIVSWALFSDVTNLRGLCVPCHSTVTSKFDRGFGNKPKAGKTDFIAPTTDGTAGRQFIASTISVQKLNDALPQTQAELDDLLSSIPE
jgi:hypothetical protein